MSNRPLPKDEGNAEVYIGKIKERASPTGASLQKLRDIRADEIERLKSEAELEQWKKTIDDFRRGGRESGSSLAQLLFKDKSAQEIDQVLSNLTPEKLENLKRVAQAVDPIASVMAQPPSSSRDDLLLKYILEQKDRGIENIIAVVKLMKEMQPQQPVHAPQPQGAGGGMTQTLETIRVINEMNKPFYDSLGKKDKEIWDLKMKEIEARMPADPVEQIKYIKEMYNTLGMGGGKSEVDLRLEAMRQEREVDMKRLDWEQKKYELEAEQDLAKWEQIGKILQGPIGQAIQNMGNAGADRVRGRKNNGNPSPSPSNMPNPVQTQCPNCNSVIWVDSEAATAICGHCGAVLQKSASPTPQQPPPQPARVEAPEPEETEEIEAEEIETEEEIEDEPNETENEER